MDDRGGGYKQKRPLAQVSYNGLQMLLEELA